MAATPESPPEAFFLCDGRTRLFASLHHPRAGLREPLGVVITPALLDEHIACYRILHRLADRLAAAGVPVLRFDPPGHGDSEGELADATPERVARAARDGARVLRERFGVARVGHLGVRLGCAAALAAAGATPRSFCIAWAPILSAQLYFRDLLRRQVISDVMYGGTRRSVDALLAGLSEGGGDANGGIDVGGYLLSGPLYDAYRSGDLVGALGKTAFPLLVIQRETPSPGSPRPLIEQVAKTVTCHHALDDEVFWSFPREGSVPPTPARWFDVTLEWILAQRDGDEG
jgi:pimeloyl-ACP methyl ester carboxylesterase